MKGSHWRFLSRRQKISEVWLGKICQFMEMDWNGWTESGRWALLTPGLLFYSFPLIHDLIRGYRLLLSKYHFSLFLFFPLSLPPSLSPLFSVYWAITYEIPTPAVCHIVPGAAGKKKHMLSEGAWREGGRAWYITCDKHWEWVLSRAQKGPQVLIRLRRAGQGFLEDVTVLQSLEGQVVIRWTALQEGKRCTGKKQ